MNKNKMLIAKLKVSPCFIKYPLKDYSCHLYTLDNSYFIECYIQATKSRAKTTVTFTDNEAFIWIDKLKNTSIPVVSNGLVVLDGEYIELFISGYNSNIQIFWHSYAPSGCEVLGEFVDWLLVKSDIEKLVSDWK